MKLKGKELQWYQYFVDKALEAGPAEKEISNKQYKALKDLMKKYKNAEVFVDDFDKVSAASQEGDKVANKKAVKLADLGDTLANNHMFFVDSIKENRRVMYETVLSGMSNFFWG